MLQLKYASSAPSEAILLQLFVIDPMALDVFTGPALVPASTTARPTLSDVSGFNQFDPQGESQPNVISLYLDAHRVRGRVWWYSLLDLVAV